MKLYLYEKVILLRVRNEVIIYFCIFKWGYVMIFVWNKMTVDLANIVVLLIVIVYV